MIQFILCFFNAPSSLFLPITFTKGFELSANRSEMNLKATVDLSAQYSEALSATLAAGILAATGSGHHSFYSSMKQAVELVNWGCFGLEIGVWSGKLKMEWQVSNGKENGQNQIGGRMLKSA